MKLKLHGAGETLIFNHTLSNINTVTAGSAERISLIERLQSSPDDDRESDYERAISLIHSVLVEDLRVSADIMICVTNRRSSIDCHHHLPLKDLYNEESNFY